MAGSLTPRKEQPAAAAVALRISPSHQAVLRLGTETRVFPTRKGDTLRAGWASTRDEACDEVLVVAMEIFF